MGTHLFSGIVDKTFHASISLKRTVLYDKCSKMTWNYLHFCVFRITWAKQRTIWAVACVIVAHPFFAESSGPTIWNVAIFSIIIRLRINCQVTKTSKIIRNYLYKSKSHQLGRTFRHFCIGKDYDKRFPIYHMDIVLGTRIEKYLNYQKFKY